MIAAVQDARYGSWSRKYSPGVRRNSPTSGVLLGAIQRTRPKANKPTDVETSPAKISETVSLNPANSRVGCFDSRPS